MLAPTPDATRTGAAITRTRALALLLPLALAGTALQAPLASGAPAGPSRYVLPGQEVEPEGITAAGETCSVTATTDGTVFRDDVDEPRNGRGAIVVQSGTGLLFRVGLSDGGKIGQISPHGQRLTAGDGLELDGSTLYVVRNALGRIAEVHLGRPPTHRRAAVRDDRAEPALADHGRRRGRPPARGQQPARQAPERPFTVSSLKIP